MHFKVLKFILWSDPRTECISSRVKVTIDLTEVVYMFQVVDLYAHSLCLQVQVKSACRSRTKLPN